MNDALEAFAELVRMEGSPSHLFEAALQISALVDEPADPSWRVKARDTVRSAGMRFQGSPESFKAEDDTALLRHFAHYFAGDLGFAGDHENYHDPANSSLLTVIRRRAGLPITLSVLFIELARHAGITCHGLAAPRHFLVGAATSAGQWVIDPFNESRMTPLADHIAELAVETNTAPEYLATHFQPAPVRVILKRMLRNLMVSYSTIGEAGKLLETFDWSLAIDPNDAEDLFNRGVLRLRTGSFAGGARDLLRLLEFTPPDDPNRPHIEREAREAVRRMEMGE